MLFRDRTNGDLVILNQNEFLSKKQFYTEVRKLFGIAPKKTHIVDKENQVDFIYGLLSRKRPSSQKFYVNIYNEDKAKSQTQI